MFLVPISSFYGAYGTSYRNPVDEIPPSRRLDFSPDFYLVSSQWLLLLFCLSCGICCYNEEPKIIEDSKPEICHRTGGIENEIIFGDVMQLFLDFYLTQMSILTPVQNRLS